MTTSPHQTLTAEPPAGSDDFDVVADEPRSAPAVEWRTPYTVGRPSSTAGPTAHSADHTGSSATTATEYAASTGMPGRGVIICTALVTALVVVVDLVLVARLSFFFDVCFVVVCLVAALAVSTRDLFAVAVLPPLAFAAAVAAVALLRPDAILETGSLAQTFLTGLAAHAPGLVGGYAAALLTVGARVYARRRDA